MPMKRAHVAFLLSVPLLAGCGPVNTVPAPLASSDPIQHYDLEVPDSLEIRAVDFQATTFADVGGMSGIVTSNVGGRAFLKVYAVHKRTGDQYLLVYENISKRRLPTFIVRFVPVPTHTLLRPDDGRPR